MSEITLLTCILTVVRSAVGVMTSPGYSTRFPPTDILVRCILDFWGHMSHTACIYVTSLYLGISWCKMNPMVLVTACYFYPCESRHNLLHIVSSHTGTFFLMRSLYPKTFPVVSQWMWCAVGSTVIVSVSGSTFISWSSHWWTVWSFPLSVVNTVIWLLNVVTWCNFCVLDRLLYICMLGLYTGFPL